MATTTDRPTSPQEKFPDIERAGQGPRRSRGDAGRWGRLFLTLFVVLGLVGLVAYGGSRIAGFSGSGGGGTGPLTHTVMRQPLRISVTEDGNVESANAIEVKCRVKGGSTILWIVKDGAEVEKGAKIIELDPAPIEDSLTQQRITVANARSTYLQAKQQYEAAKISIEEYLKGNYVQQKTDLQASIRIAEQNLNSAKDQLQYTKTLFQKGYSTELDLQAKQAAVERAQLELQSAETALMVLEKYTKNKTLTELESAAEQAKAQMDAAKATLDLEQSKLEDFQKQLENCTITAPQSGMIVYANDRGWGPDTVIEEGAQVRERQTIVRIPNLDAMQVEVLVHESKINQIEVGMPAAVQVQGRTVTGSVKSIANQPEPTRWFDADIREYATIVQVDGGAQGLRPGMTAAVEILIAELKDDPSTPKNETPLTVPVTAVVEDGSGRMFAWVQTPQGRPERRPVVPAKFGNGRFIATNDKLIGIADGLKEGDLVILNPRATVEEAREVAEESKEKDEGGESNAEGQPKGESGGRAGRGDGQGRGGSDSAGSPRGRGGRDRSGGRGPDGQRGSGGGGGPGNVNPDKNGDGKISKEEAPERMKPFFDRLDTNSDGFIDQAEREEAKKRFQQQGQQGQQGEQQPDDEAQPQNSGGQ